MPQADTQLTERGGRAAPGTARAMTEHAAGCNYRFACFELQPYERRLLAAGEPAAVSPHAFDLLIALVAHAGRLVTKEELLERVWPNLVVEENNLDKQVSNLRRILGADAIETIRGRGYRFTLPAMRVEVAATALAAKSRRTNLPASLTSFVGRQREIAEIKRLLPDSRLLTLVGIGGIGKTRLALQAAAEVLDAYRDGVWFVDLAPLNDPALVASALAQVLGVSEAAGKPLVETLCAQINGRQLLLVLDNCEHLLEASALLADAVLRSAAEAAIIATSRETFHIAGEQTYPLSALSVPDPSASAEEVGRSEAVQLFVERARRHQPDFALTAARARAVAELCIHLDGIPLALELAAARVRSLSIEQINARLDDRFKLLTDGNRAALPRQQTLRGTLDWSHALLSEHERVLLRRLAIFVGGFTLEAAAAVASDERIDKPTVIELLSQLVERSLVVADTNDAHARYRLLETTRAYALEKLAESGEIEAIKRRHAQHFRDRLAPAFDDSLRLSDSAWHDLYVPERDNVRVALDWAFGTSGDAAIGVALAGASGRLWGLSLSSEGRQRLEAAAARVESHTSKVDQARLWVWLGSHRCAPALAAAHLERAIELYRGLEETPLLGAALASLSIEMGNMGRLEQAALALAKAFPLLERSGPMALGRYFTSLGLLELKKGDLSAARMHVEKGLRLYRDAGGEAMALGVLGILADITWALGDLDAALAAFLQLVAQQRNTPLLFKRNLGMDLVNLAGIRTERGELDEALAAAREGLPLLQELDAAAWHMLDHLALRAALAGTPADAARIAGYADLRYTAEKMLRPLNEARARERLQALLREKLDAGKLERLLAEGAKLSEDEACRLSLED